MSYNNEHYPDPVAGKAVKNISRQEDTTKRRAGRLMTAILIIVDLAGFELVDRVRFRRKRREE